MENLHYNLSEEEFSKSKKILLWSFALFFFIAGAATLYVTLVYQDSSINVAVSAVPFGISLAVGIIAGMATFKRSDNFFTVDNEKIEFRYGFMNPKSTSYIWSDVIEVQFPHKQKKVKLILKNNLSAIINLTWIQKKKASHIRKHLFYCAKEKNINIVKTQVLS
jgi:hypothetical protein